MDKIFLEGLVVETVIGVWEWERRIRQKVKIDVEFGTDIREAAASDDIADTLNYKEAADGIRALADKEFRLVEAFTEAIAEYLLREFSLPWVSVRVAKLGAIRGSREVGVRIERCADDPSD